MSSFQIRKAVFDYLKAELVNVAEVLPQHPSGDLSTINLPKIVVSLVRDQASGLYVSQEIQSPEIQIMAYSSSSNELTLSKPTTGIFERVVQQMKTFTDSNVSSFHKIRDSYLGFNYENFCFSGFLIYRFYLK